MDQISCKKTSNFFQQNNSHTSKNVKSRGVCRQEQFGFPQYKYCTIKPPSLTSFLPTMTEGNADVIWVLGEGSDETCMGHSRNGITHKKITF